MQRKSSAKRIVLLEERCRKHNLKITPQRIEIYEELIKSKNHPSADAVFQTVRKKFPHISLDTVNRTLSTFSEIGILEIMEGYGNPRRFDPNTNSHHHVHCIKCRKIVDFYSDDYDDLEVPKDIQERFIIFSKKVVLSGICEECRREK